MLLTVSIFVQKAFSIFCVIFILHFIELGLMGQRESREWTLEGSKIAILLLQKAVPISHPVRFSTAKLILKPQVCFSEWEYLVPLQAFGKVMILVLKVLDVSDSDTDPLSKRAVTGSPFAVPPPSHLHVSWEQFRSAVSSLSNLSGNHKSLHLCLCVLFLKCLYAHYLM